MVLIHQVQLDLSHTYKPFKCPNMVGSTVTSTVIIGS